MDIEEGEIVDSDEDAIEAYNPLPRPGTGKPRELPRQASSLEIEYSDVDSDPESSSDSDASLPAKTFRPSTNNIWEPRTEKHHGGDKFKQKATAFHKERTEKSIKKNLVWSHVIQEQTLSQELSGFDVRHGEYNRERSVESYDYRRARRNESEEENEEGEEEMELTDVKNAPNVRKRTRDQRNQQKDPQALEILDLKVTEASSDDEVACDIANKLYEPKTDLLLRVVQILGRKTAIQLFKETQEVEASGGIMVLNGSRRRTPGGVYLHLLKNNPDLTQEDIKQVFIEEMKKNEEENKNRRIRKRRKNCFASLEQLQHEKLPSLPSRAEAMMEVTTFDNDPQPDDPSDLEDVASLPVPSESRLNNTPENSEEELEISCKTDDIF